MSLASTEPFPGIAPVSCPPPTPANGAPAVTTGIDDGNDDAGNNDDDDDDGDDATGNNDDDDDDGKGAVFDNLFVALSRRSEDGTPKTIMYTTEG